MSSKKVPIYGRFGKGDPDTEIDGDVIEGLKGESLGDAVKARLIPPGGDDGQVVGHAGGVTKWGPVPIPNLDGLVDFIEPNRLVFDETVTVDAQDTNKHQILDYHIPLTGEVTVTVHAQPLIIAGAEPSRKLFSVDPRLSEVVGGQNLWHALGPAEDTFDWVIWWAHAGKNIGFVHNNDTCVAYWVDLTNRTYQVVGTIHGLGELAGVCIVNDTVVVMEAAAPQRLFNLSLASHRFALRGTAVSDDHGAFVENTLVYHKGRILALAQVGETDTVALVHLGDNGVVTQVGAVLPHGTPADVGAMVEFKGELYVFRGTIDTVNRGEFRFPAPVIYHLATVFSSDPPTISLTETGEAGGVGLDGDLTWIAVAGFNDVTFTLDTDSLKGLGTVTSKAEVFHGQHKATPDGPILPPNAHALPGGDFSVGHSADRRLSFAAQAVSEATVQIHQREFAKLRPVVTGLLSESADVPWDGTTSHVVNLIHGGWQEGDRLRLLMAPIYNTAWEAAQSRHQQVYEIDTADFRYRSHETLFYHLQTRQFSVSTNDIDEGVKADLANPLGFIRISLDRAQPTAIKFWPHDSVGHASGDIGLRLYQIIRYR